MSHSYMSKSFGVFGTIDTDICGRIILLNMKMIVQVVVVFYDLSFCNQFSSIQLNRLRYKQILELIKDMLDFHHLRSVCMSYVEHFAFSVYLGGHFFVGFVCAVIHAFFPFVLGKTSTILSNKIRTIISNSGCK